RDFNADPVSAQLDGEISEIGVASHQNHNVGPHLDGKLERVDRHHHVYVCLIMTFFGGRTVFGHDHESVGAQPVDKLVFLIPLLLPSWDRRRKPGVNHHFDQVTSCVWHGEKIPELYPIVPWSSR